MALEFHLTPKQLSKQTNIPFNIEGKPQRKIVLEEMQKVENILRSAFPDVFVAVVPFGSRVRGYATDTPKSEEKISDVDLAVIVDKQDTNIIDFCHAKHKENNMPDISVFVDVSLKQMNLLFKSFQKKSMPSVDNITKFLFMGFGSSTDAESLRKHRLAYIDIFRKMFKNEEEQKEAVRRISELIALKDVSRDKAVERMEGIIPIDGRSSEKLRWLIDQRSLAWQRKLDRVLVDRKP